MSAPRRCHRRAAAVAARAALLAGLALLVPPAIAGQSWMPVVSVPAEQAEDVAPYALARELERGWSVMVTPAIGRPSGAGNAVIDQSSAGSPARSAAPSPRRLAQQQTPAPLVSPVPPERARRPAGDAGSQAEAGVAQQYCGSIADAAADARFAWQKKTLGEIERELDRRIDALEARTAELRQWLARREEFMKKAQETLVRIYARMRPDAAAAQLAAMDEGTAAAVLTRLDPLNASAILNEMPAEPAARLTTTIAGAASLSADGAAQRGQSRAPAASGKRS